MWRRLSAKVHSLNISVDESSADCCLSLTSFVWLPAGAFLKPKDDGPIATYAQYIIGPFYVIGLLALGEAGLPLSSCVFSFRSAAPSSASTLFSQQRFDLQVRLAALSGAVPPACTSTSHFRILLAS